MASTPSPTSSVAASTRRAQARSASMSSPESSSSSSAMAGRSTPSWSVSFFFFSPPDRSTLSGRSTSRGSSASRSTSARISASTATTSRPAARAADSSRAWSDTPGTSVGYCSARKSPACARCHGSSPRRSTPSRVALPPSTSYPGRPMSTWASVDLPDPLGPMTACTSPERTVRSMPRRISLPDTPARSPEISSTWPTLVDVAALIVALLIDHHHDVTVVDADVVDGLGLGRRQARRLAGLERELAAVLPALDGLVVGVNLTLGQRDVLVGAGVADRVDVVADAHHRDAVPAHDEPTRLSGRQLVEAAQPLLRRRHYASRRSNLAATVARRTGTTEGTGRRPSTSSKNPLTISLSASSVGTPRLSR